MNLRLFTDSAYRLRLTYLCFVLPAFLQLFFFACLFNCTVSLVKEQFHAADFLRQVEVIPLPAKQILWLTVIFISGFISCHANAHRSEKHVGVSFCFCF